MGVPEDTDSGGRTYLPHAQRRQSSAKPSNLIAYRDQGLAQVASLEALAAGLRTALEDLRSAMGNFDLPDGVWVPVPGLEDDFESGMADLRHLDEWVGDVGHDFAEAGGMGDEIPAGVSVTVPNSAITVGYADRQQSERQARQDAERLATILDDIGHTGLFSPGQDPDRIEELAEQYPDLQDFLADTARFHDDESYAAVLVNGLGAQDVRTLVDLTTTFGTAEHRGIIEGDTWNDYLVPVAALVSAADRSGRLSQEVHDVLVDPGTSDDPVWGDEQGHGVGLSVTADRARANALLLYAGDFPPYTTAELANGVMDTLHGGEYGATAGDFEHRGTAYTGPEHVRVNPALSSMEWMVLESLDENPHASNIFWTMDEHANLPYMEDLGGADFDAERRLDEAGVDDLPYGADHEIEMHRAGSLQDGLLDFPAGRAGLEDGTYGSETVEVVSAAFAHAGGEDVNLSNPVRQALAEVSTPYTVDIAVAADPSAESSAAENQDPPRLPDDVAAGGVERLMLDLSPGDVNRFIGEVSQHEDARIVLARNGAALINQQINIAAPQITAEDPNPVGTESSVVISYFNELGQAWNDLGRDEVQRRAEVVEGWRQLTDPVLHVVTGGLLEHGPVGAITGATGIDNVYAAVEEDVTQRINEAAYGVLVDDLEGYGTMDDWREGMEASVEISLNRALYGNEELRVYYLERDGRTHQQAVEEAATIPYDEFIGLDGVGDDVAAWHRQIANDVLARTAFGQTIGGEPAPTTDGG